MGESCSCVEKVVIVSNDAIKSIVFTLSELGIEREVGHSVVGISVEVSLNVNGSLVEGLIVVIGVSFKLMGVN